MSDDEQHTTIHPEAIKVASDAVEKVAREQLPKVRINIEEKESF